MSRGGALYNTQLKGEDEAMAKKVAIPWELKWDFAMRG